MANKKFESNAVFNGEVETTKLKVTSAGGDEGGEILLGKPATNTTIAGIGVTVDVFQNKLRFFEQGGDARGYYLDITGGGAGVGTNIIGGGSASDSFKTISVTGQSSVVADSSTDTLSLVAGTNVSITTNATADSITINTTGSLPVGGTAGQILAKSSSTDYATEWIENYADYTEIVKLKVKNDGTRALLKGQPVYVTGADGTNVLVGRSTNATEGGSSKTIGLLAQNLATNGQGFVIMQGKLGTLDTSTAGLVGDPVWLGVDGALIYGLDNKPYGGAHLVYLGVVTKKNGSTGEIFVKVQNGFEITELHDVGIGYSASIADNEVLAYDTTSGTWINQTALEAGLAALAGAVFTGDVELDVTRKLIFDGATDEAYKTSLYIVDPTNDRSILLPDASGTLALTGDISTIVGDYIPLTQKGAAQGVAELDIDTLVPVEQIPDLSATYLTPTAADLDYQPLDADLTAIAALTSNGILRKTSGTWGMDTATYLTSFTESDPIFVAHAAYNVTSTKIGNWDSAYGWGDHSLASYASSSHNHTLNSLSNVVITGTPSDGQALVWDTTTSKWVNETVTQDLSAYAPLASPTFTGTVTIPVGASISGYLTTSSASSTYAPLAGATFTGNIAINNGTSTAITTTGTTATVFNSNATTIEIGHAATTLSIGSIAHTGTTTINNDLAVYGSITFSQGASSLSATTIQIDDTLISLADANTADILDIGFYAGYRQSSTDYHTGLVRDASDSGKWKLFAGVTAQPTGTVDFTSATYGTLKVGVLEVDSAGLSTTRTNLGATTIGSNLFTLTNPSAVSFPKYNADNTVVAESAATHKTSLSLNNVENTALSTWAGSTNITTLGAVSATSINSTPIGATTASTGRFTSVDIDGKVLINTFIGTGSGVEQELGTEDSWGSAYSCAEYIVSVSNGLTGRYTSKVMLMSNGSTSSITEYAIQTVGTITSPTITAGTTPSALKLRINAVNGYAITLVRTLVGG
jgi:hypothetical protein